MARLLVKDDITSGGALAVGQALRLGGFIMTAPSAIVLTMASRVITHNLRIGSEISEQMDPMELSSLNELLDRIAALGVATDYDRIGLKPDQRDIKSPPVTHEIAVVEEPHTSRPSTLRTNYVRITKLNKPNTYPKGDMTRVPDLESGIGPKRSGDTPDLRLSGSEPSAPPGSDRIKIRLQPMTPAWT